MNKKQLIVIALMILFTVAGFYCFARGKTEVVWQQSEGVTVQLGVRDKYGALNKYKALFVVTVKNGKDYQVEKQINSGDWGYVYFPDDFKVYGEPGDYTWKCFVDGKVVTNGKFSLTTAKTYSDQANVIRE